MPHGSRLIETEMAMKHRNEIALALTLLVILWVAGAPLPILVGGALVLTYLFYQNW